MGPHDGHRSVKLFSAASGGPPHLRRLRGPLPEIPLIPTGGIAISDVAGYLTACAAAVGIGSSSLGGTVGDGELGELRKRTRRRLAAIAEGPKQ